MGTFSLLIVFPLNSLTDRFSDLYPLILMLTSTVGASKAAKPRPTLGEQMQDTSIPPAPPQKKQPELDITETMMLFLI